MGCVVIIRLSGPRKEVRNQSNTHTHTKCIFFLNSFVCFLRAEWRTLVFCEAGIIELTKKKGRRKGKQEKKNNLSLILSLLMSLSLSLCQPSNTTIEGV